MGPAIANDSPANAISLIASTNVRTGLGADAIATALIENLHCLQGKLPRDATRNDWYMALAYTVRDRMMERYVATVGSIAEANTDAKVVAYLSAEFLTGPHLGNGLINLGIWQAVEEALSRVGQDLSGLLEEEEEPGLGNGGLGRLAACYMDSLATLNVPAIGYGIRYEFGIFDQVIRDGWQVEVTDKWLRFGNPWEIVRSEIAFEVKFGGRTEPYHDEAGRYRVRWLPEKVVKGIAYDTPIPGYRVPTTNLLRLWKAEATESFDFEAFNVGDYYRAVDEKVISETISKVLYPNDEPEAGKQLRLAQQYFFVSCSLQDMIRLLLLRGKPLNELHSYWAAQLNDTHPSIAVAELLRILVDEHAMEWGRAWAITQQTCAYTNHTLLAEALERWPLPLLAKLLPRHLEIIYEINRRFLDDLRVRYPNDDQLLRRLSLIDEAGDKHIRMAHLASVGSHAINGVALLHTELLKRTVLHDFHRVSPEKFLNVTNGVTPRRWIALSNPKLSALITRHIGDRWVADLEHELPQLERLVVDTDFQKDWQVVKSDNKRVLAGLIKEQTGILVDPNSLFDIQVKRLHEYKRQHLNLLYLVTLYNRLRRDSSTAGPPRTVIFGGKAAPGYRMAKLIIKLINSVAGTVNQDPLVSQILKVVFLPDFNVKNSHRVYPAADLSEQISTTGKEASGTGNMKFAMNGALTIGTLDGANIEIRDAVGHENFFSFGLTAEEVERLKAEGYTPRRIYESNPELREAIDLISSGFFSNGDRELFHPLVDSLLTRDDYMLLADYQAYVDCQQRVSHAYSDQNAWTRMSILNSARAGRFSSDRSIREYCRDIWKVRPIVPDERWT
ncbi:glycogen/starch/alpha-glucan phosphorylase (plasmid) [Bradyrhizobium sp. PMVTL-01]|uniref:glycogen/starch/alpha-glucan phosphorylase n=1 Tax=Bradyrhizobium sp. PMVTL-01 TaxID=3434999 RepID=UPI003F6F7B6F